jgi:uncharacterized protein YxjI
LSLRHIRTKIEMHPCSREDDHEILHQANSLFPWLERFTVRDEKERDVLAAVGEKLSPGAILHLLDLSGREIGLINQQLLGWQPRYRVEINGRQAGFVVRRFALVGSRFDFDGIGWAAEGTFGSHDYTVYDHRAGCHDGAQSLAELGRQL